MEIRCVFVELKQKKQFISGTSPAVPSPTTAYQSTVPSTTTSPPSTVHPVIVIPVGTNVSASAMYRDPDKMGNKDKLAIAFYITP